tara:strand:- start:536 stop:1561 length:1026 start_codon:yes stop_codon:yes gene_type:complete
MIQARKSNEYLSKENLLSKVSEYQIFKYFCRNFKELNTKFRSDLRDDKSPTVSIALIGQSLLYKDFGHPEHTFNCIDYVAYKYNLDFYGALIHIDGCFGLGLHSGVRIRGLVPQVAEPVLREKKRSEIQVRVRDWDYRDAAYWKQFGISKKLLRIFDVQPITHYWINEQRFSCNSISYRYRFDCGYKIYRPLERDFKWSSNVGMECLQGYRQLPEHGETLVLTSSLKDIMCLAVLDYPSIALQSEMLVPGQGTIEEAQARFKEVIVLYDNDFDNPRNPGQTMAVKICEKYGLDNIVIPSYYRSKDISDLIKDHGLQEAKYVIERQENRRSYIKKESTERQE